MWRVSAQVSREPPPPLPGGYTVGEQVYYTGASHTFECGDRLERGKQGEVVEVTLRKGSEGKGLHVLFPGNKGAINCYLISVCRRRHRAATHSSPPPQLLLLSAHHTLRVGAWGRTGEP